MSNVAVIPVKTASRNYEVHVGTGLLQGVGELIRQLLPTSGRAFIVRDSGVPADLAATLSSSLSAAGFSTVEHLITPSERAKSVTTLAGILSAIAATRHERRDPVVAIGGGIVGDITGFAAASYRRGVPVVQCPTTLLSMVDASVGGKTGVNITTPAGDLLKNMAGAFHQPHLVIADVSSLRSLGDRQFRCGLAECLKHGMLSGGFGDPELFDWTVKSLGAILARDPGTLAELATRNIRMKATVVAGDEREEDSNGGRALLNLGHTFGHAIETIPELRAPGAGQPGIEHGEAVGLGLIAAATAAEAIVPQIRGIRDETLHSLRAAGLPVAVEGLPSTDRVVELMSHDKKAARGILRLILPDAGRTARVVERPDIRAVHLGIESLRSKR